MPEDTILLCAGRTEGRRMLTLCAGRQLLMGVHAETALSLAMELCAPLLASGWRLMESAEACELVLECLKSLPEDSCLARPAVRTLAAARTVYAALQELTMACVELPAGADRAGQLQALQEEYRRRKTDSFRLDRGDLFCKALEELKKGTSPLLKSRYVALGSYAPRPLERRLVDALTEGGRLTVVPLGIPEGTQPPFGALEQGGEPVDSRAGLGGRCRFFRCRGKAAEVQHVLRDILAQGRKADRCAVVFLSGEYGPLLQETAGRFGIPVTLGGGLPMTGSLLFHAMEQTALLPEQEFNAEQVCALLDQRSWLMKKENSALSARIRRKNVGWGSRERYETVLRFWKGETPPDAESVESWRHFLDLLFAVAAPGDREVEEQRRDLLEFLSAYANRTLTGEAAAYAAVVELIGSVTAPAAGETLLQRTVRLMGTMTYAAAGAAPGSLFCVPLEQALCTGRDHLYVVGLSRYAIQGGKESPVLLDEDRRDYPALETVERREKEMLFRFRQMVEQHEGSFTFTYPDFETDRMIPALPSPELEELMAAAGVAQAQTVDLIHGTPLTAGDRICTAGAVELLPSEGTWAADAKPAALEARRSLKEQLEGFVFSPSSLETALKCPLQFYLQKMLKLNVSDPPRRQENSWLEKKTVGTLCHEVLERFYQDAAAPQDIGTPEGRERLEALFGTCWAAVEEEQPPTRRELMEADREKAWAMVLTAAGWTRDEGRRVLHTEQKFGTSDDGTAPEGLKLTVDGKDFLLSGSIDRVDELSDGSIAVVDYKTGSVRKMEREKHLHLQDFLYSLAEKALSGGKYVPAEAGYLMLENGAFYLPGDRSRDGEVEKTIRALLEWLEDETKAQEAAPVFSLSGGSLQTGSESRRRGYYGACSRYCTLKTLCPWYREEAEEDD